jgi:isoleucyl-tRNA synthetase
MAVGTLMFDRSPYRNVLALGHILAEDGRKMSKHLGNVLDPIAVMEQHGADAVRWFMAVAGSPWAARRLDHRGIEDGARNVLMTYWNTAAFQALYARASGWHPDDKAPVVAHRPVLDRWLHAETATVIRDVTRALEHFDSQRAGTLLARFVDDVSNWYVRRSRRRFWHGDAAAFATLHHTLHTVTLLLAPLIPVRHRTSLAGPSPSHRPQRPSSVHLAQWQTYEDSASDERLLATAALARKLVELGRAARAVAKIRTRQPLQRALVGSAAWEGLGPELRNEVANELNVELLEPFKASANAELVAFSA